MKNSLLIKTFRFQGDAFDLMILFKNRQKLFFLDSSLHQSNKGRYSFIGFDPVDWVEGRNHDGLKILRERYKKAVVKVQTPLTPFPAGLAGSLSYDYGLYQENIKLAARDDLKLPLYVFGFYDGVLTVDHQKKRLIVTCLNSAKSKFSFILKTLEEFIFDKSVVLPEKKNVIAKADQKLTRIQIKANFTKKQYLSAVKKVMGYIEAGDIYQANLSQRFHFDGGQQEINQTELYQILRNFSPTDFSSYFDAGHFQIISSSPERFLKIRNGIVTTSPMKGTRPRGKNQREDEHLRQQILNSEKDKAELLMVTDLERNDLGRVCQFGSVKVEKMREIEKYRFVYQATSTVKGVLRKDKDVFDVLQACFPSGSITGCPKIQAMEIIEALEPTRRSFYTGSLGYISLSGDMDFNILIRTLLISRNKIYFQVGGGVVADSVPSNEYEETLVKAKALSLSLEKYFQRNEK